MAISRGESHMANLTVKKLPDDLYEKLKEQAHAHRRSIAAETTVILERALGERLTTEFDVFHRAARLRGDSRVYLTENELAEAVRHGRS
ncbi:MAG: hypothetical protein WD423_00300 [Rhodothermales bacterium]